MICWPMKWLFAAVIDEEIICELSSSVPSTIVLSGTASRNSFPQLHWFPDDLLCTLLEQQ